MKRSSAHLDTKQMRMTAFFMKPKKTPNLESPLPIKLQEHHDLELSPLLEKIPSCVDVPVMPESNSMVMDTTQIGLGNTTPVSLYLQSDTPGNNGKINCKGKRKFQEGWLKELLWLSYDKRSGIARCETCVLFPDICDANSKVVSGFVAPFKLETFKKHGKSIQHVNCTRANEALKHPETTPLAKCVKKMDAKMFEHLETVFSSAYYIAKNNKPFSDLKELLVLVKKFDVSVLDQYNSDKSCKMFIFHIAQVIKEELAMELKNCSFVSVLLDASTDNSSEEQLVLYVRFIKDRKVKEVFLSIVPLKNGSAQGYLDTLSELLKHLNLDKWLSGESLVGIGTDGAASMIGKDNGLVSKLASLPGLEHLVGIHCVAHQLNLSVLKSIKNVKYLEKIDFVLKKLFKFYQYSPKRMKQLQKVAEILGCEILKFQYLHNVRWVASKVSALTALVRNYQCVVTDLEDISNGRGEDAATAKGILKELKSFRFVITLHFLLDFLIIFDNLSRVFQKSDLLLSSVDLHINRTVTALENLKIFSGEMEEKVVSSTTLNGNFLNIQLAGVDDAVFKNDKEKILTDSILYLKERFSGMSQLSQATSVRDTFAWPTGPEFVNFGVSEIKLLGLHYKKLLGNFHSETELVETLLCEWYKFKVLGKGLKLEELLDRAISMNDRFPVLSKLISVVCVLPVSTASCERGFSLMNSIKNKFRSRMENDSLNDLMMLDMNGPTLQDFNPRKGIDNWFFKTKTSRHVQGHKQSTSGEK